MFNIYVLSNIDSYFYVYPEYFGKEGAAEVCSFLFNYVFNFLDLNV